MNKAYKFRIYPDKEQEILFAKTFGCVRLVYNYYLDKRIQQYQMDQSTLNYTWCANDMAKLKKTEEYSLLKEVDSIALQQSLRHLDAAFQNFLNTPNLAFQNSSRRRAAERVIRRTVSMAILLLKTAASSFQKWVLSKSSSIVRSLRIIN